MDAVDAVLLDFGEHSLQIIAYRQFPIAADIRRQVKALDGSASLADVSELDAVMGELFAVAVQRLLQESGTRAVVCPGTHVYFDRGEFPLRRLLEAGVPTYLGTDSLASNESLDMNREIDLACFGVGAYDPWEHMHATPEQVWRMFVALGARYLLPIHHSTFELSDEPVDEPLARLRAAAGDDADCVLDVAPGEVVTVPRREA